MLGEEGGAFINAVPVKEAGLRPELAFEDALHGPIDFPLREDIGFPGGGMSGPEDAAVIFREGSDLGGDFGQVLLHALGAPVIVQGDDKGAAFGQELVCVSEV